jgi:hypothetical protein
MSEAKRGALAGLGLGAKAQLVWLGKEKEEVRLRGGER